MHDCSCITLRQSWKSEANSEIKRDVKELYAWMLVSKVNVVSMSQNRRCECSISLYFMKIKQSLHFRRIHYAIVWATVELTPWVHRNTRWDRTSMVVRPRKIDLHCFVEWFSRLFYNYVLNISVIQCIPFEKQLHVPGFMYHSSWDRGRFVKNFRFDTIRSIT